MPAEKKIGVASGAVAAGGDEQWVETGEEDETTSTQDRRRQARNDKAGKRE